MIALLFDTETTGIPENRTVKMDRQPEIIEFYGCIADLRTSTISQEFHTLIKPKKKITPEIIKITGITNEMVADAPPFENCANEIQALFDNAERYIAHNLSFDKDMIEIEFERLGRKFVWPKEGICTVEQTIYLKGFRLKMGALYELLFGETFGGAHRANIDVAALLRCSTELYAKGIL